MMKMNLIYKCHRQQSMGVERTIENEQQEGEEGYANLEENDEVENIKDFNNNTGATSYYNQYIPEQNMQSYQMPVSTNIQSTSSIDDKLTHLNKFIGRAKNRTIRLNITEEIILYQDLIRCVTSDICSRKYKSREIYR